METGGAAHQLWLQQAVMFIKRYQVQVKFIKSTSNISITGYERSAQINYFLIYRILKRSGKPFRIEPGASNQLLMQQLFWTKLSPKCVQVQYLNNSKWNVKERDLRMSSIAPSGACPTQTTQPLSSKKDSSSCPTKYLTASSTPCIKQIKRSQFNCNTIIPREQVCSPKPLIVSVIEIDNVGVSKLSIDFSLLKSKASAYTTVVDNYTVPHNKTKSITTGSFPALYVRIRCHKGTPISMQGLRIYGNDPDQVSQQVQMQSQGTHIGVQSYLAIAQTGNNLL